MRLQDSSAKRPEIKEKRRGVRLNSRVPVMIEWEGAAGENLHDQAFTRVLNAYGCLVVLPQNLPVKQPISLMNLATKHANSAVVVWKGNCLPDGWELGIELTRPPFDFWGVEL